LQKLSATIANTVQFLAIGPDWIRICNTLLHKWGVGAGIRYVLEAAECLLVPPLVE
jgi:hypothetical protein